MEISDGYLQYALDSLAETYDLATKGCSVWELYAGKQIIIHSVFNLPEEVIFRRVKEIVHMFSASQWGEKLLEALKEEQSWLGISS